MMDTVRTLTDTVVLNDTVRITDTLWVLQSHSAWRDAFPLVGSFAAIAAALATAYLAYVFNRRLLKYNIAYGSYRRALVKLQALRKSCGVIRERTAEVGMFLATMDEALGRPDVASAIDPLKFVQDVRKEWASQSQGLQDANARLLAAKEAIDAEYLGHAPMFPNLRDAVSAHGLKILARGADVAGFVAFLLTASMRNEPFPLDGSRSLLRETKDRVLTRLSDSDVWYHELLELLRLQVFAGLVRARRHPVKRRGGNPDQLHLTLDGFKTARELGWYDPKLDTRPKKR